MTDEDFDDICTGGVAAFVGIVVVAIICIAVGLLAGWLIWGA